MLALVAHGDTSAIFAFASSKWPPEAFSDLTIESVYPLNVDFLLDTSKFKVNDFVFHRKQFFLHRANFVLIFVWKKKTSSHLQKCAVENKQHEK